MYRVIRFFTDLQDGGHPYDVGDEYPREGMAASKERVAELLGSQNRQGTPLIRKEEAEPSGLTRTTVNRMGASDLRKLATESGIDGAEGMTGADLKKALIEKHGL